MSDISKNISFPRDMLKTAKEQGKALVAFGLDDGKGQMKMLTYVATGDAEKIALLMAKLAQGETLQSAINVVFAEPE